MTGPRHVVLLVEDEPQMRRFLRATLTSHDYRLLEAATMREGERLLTAEKPDAVLLDLGLPDGDGMDLTRRTREWSRVPIIVLSARGQEQDKVNALDAGADDYLTKPFGTRELLARLRVVLRRAAEGADPSREALIEIGRLRVDLARREVCVDGAPVRLTRTEYRLLALLARNAGRVLTHRQILREVWGPGTGETHYVRVYMAGLRKKIETDLARPLIVTEQGVGYRLRDRTDDP